MQRSTLDISLSVSRLQPRSWRMSREEAGNLGRMQYINLVFFFACCKTIQWKLKSKLGSFIVTCFDVLWLISRRTHILEVREKRSPSFTFPRPWPSTSVQFPILLPWPNWYDLISDLSACLVICHNFYSGALHLRNCRRGDTSKHGSPLTCWRGFASSP